MTSVIDSLCSLHTGNILVSNYKEAQYSVSGKQEGL